MQQSKPRLTIIERGSKIDINSVFDCHLSVDKWQSKTLFLMIFDLRFRLPPIRCVPAMVERIFNAIFRIKYLTTKSEPVE